jgi:twitching motility protein PilT
MALEIDKVLKMAVDLTASDIHVKPGAPPIVRVNGDLQTLPGLEKATPGTIIEVARKIMNERQLEQYRKYHEVDLAYSLSGVGRFRVNIYQQRGSAAISFRAISTEVLDFEALQLPAVLSKVSEFQRGMVLVTGATGSGKSTTLAAILEYINQHYRRHVVTIEDPIEFLIRDKKSIISQREVGLDTPSFSRALRSSLRQDPDVILVGEMRDLETITTALMAAETGHLVLSTLHTMDVMETIHRIISFYPGHQIDQVRFQLAAALRAVVSQRLLARADGSGRIPATEVMVTTSRIRECITNKEKLHEITDAMEKGYTTYGMQTFDMALMQLLQQRKVSLEEALKYSTNPGDFALKVKGISSTGGSSDFSEWDDGPKKKGPKPGGGGMVIERFSK